MPKALKRIILAVGLSLMLAAGCGDGKDAASLRLEKARNAYNQGLYLEAEAEYERFLQEHSQHPARWEAWGRLLDITFSIKNDQEKGVILLEAMLLEYGEDQEKAAFVLQRIGDFYAEQKQWDKAIEKWAKGRRLSGQQVESQWPFLLRMARAYRAMHNYDMARETLAYGMKGLKDPKAVAACKYDLAMTYTFLENWDKSRKMLEEVLASGDLSSEDHAVATCLLADVHIHFGELDKARDLLESVSSSHPNPLAVEVKLDYLDKEILAHEKRPKPVIEEMKPEDLVARPDEEGRFYRKL
ncbi:MAG: tetratricopeptide repeat protein [Desulfocurvibacter africanus]